MNRSKCEWVRDHKEEGELYLFEWELVAKPLKDEEEEEEKESKWERKEEKEKKRERKRARKKGKKKKRDKIISVSFQYTSVKYLCRRL